MNKATGLWLDMSIGDESMKRITILPEKINDDTKSILLKLYGDLIEEVTNVIKLLLIEVLTKLYGCHTALLS